MKQRDTGRVHSTDNHEPVLLVQVVLDNVDYCPLPYTKFIFGIRLELASGRLLCSSIMQPEMLLVVRFSTC